MKDRKCYLVDIKENKEDDGRLLVVEGQTQTVPFDIKRIFWVRDVDKNAERGNHATKKTNLILIPIFGSCDVLVNDGEKETVYHMDNPKQGLYIEAMLWRTMKNFSSDCVMEAICDSPYEPENETFECFEEYLKAVKGTT